MRAILQVAGGRRVPETLTMSFRPSSGSLCRLGYSLLAGVLATRKPETNVEFWGFPHDFLEVVHRTGLVHPRSWLGVL